jgi:putative oxidoreductase
LEAIRNGYGHLTRLLAWLAPAGDLVIRLWVANVFLKSGLTKIAGWDSTLFLFSNEYHVPLLPPELAAYLGTFAELCFPVLLALGLGTRFSALALFIFNIFAVVSYPFLWTEEGQVGFTNHVTWGLLLLVPMLHGAGKLSLDELLGKRLTSR